MEQANRRGKHLIELEKLVVTSWPSVGFKWSFFSSLSVALVLVRPRGGLEESEC